MSRKIQDTWLHVIKLAVLLVNICNKETVTKQKQKLFDSYRSIIEMFLSWSNGHVHG